MFYDTVHDTVREGIGIIQGKCRGYRSVGSSLARQGVYTILNKCVGADAVKE